MPAKPSQSDVELEKFKIDAETKRQEYRHNVLKVMLGTMIVGVAAALFPFMQQLAESIFAERIETIKKDAAIATLREKNQLEKQMEEWRHQLALNQEQFSQRTSNRQYMESLATEARSERIGKRIIIAEFFSFLAEDNERRTQWAAFRDHLYKLQLKLNDERTTLLTTRNDPSATEADRESAQERLDQIERLENPDKDTAQRRTCNVQNEGVLRKATINDHRIREVTYCQGAKIRGDLSPEIILIHSSHSSQLSQSVNHYLSNSGYAVHIVIGRDGTAVQLARFDQWGSHAGTSKWKDRTGLSRYSVAIELVNWGKLGGTDKEPRAWTGAEVPSEEVFVASHKHSPNTKALWHAYTNEQIETLLVLIKAIADTYNISREDIVGHEDVSPGRKTDPGPAFPWSRIDKALEAQPASTE